MRTFKRWLGAGAIVLVALALVACPAMVPKASGSIADMSFAHGAGAKTVSDLGRFFDQADNATFKAASSNEAVATASVTDTTLTVTPMGAGTATVTVTATASNGRDTATQTFNVTVARAPDPPANTAPNVRTINNVTLDAGGSTTVDLADHVTNLPAQVAEGDTLAYDAMSSMTGYVTVSVSGSMLMITAVATGESTITVTVSDGTNAAVTRTFMVTVTAEAPPDNNQPRQTGTIPDLTGDAALDYGESATVDLSMYFTDDENDPVTYMATSTDEGVARVSDVTGSVVTIMVVDSGMATINVEVADEFNRSVHGSFKVEVTNQAPMVMTEEATRFGPYMAGHTQKIYLARYFMDPENNTLTYTAMSDMMDVATVSEVSSDDSSVTVTAVAAGTAMITITANDGTNDPVSHMLTVTVDETPPADNNPPARTGMDAPTVTLVLEDDPSETLDVSTYFMDADDDDLTYSAMSSATGVATASESGSMVTITAVSAGSATVTVTASDGRGGSADLEIMVTVEEPTNMAPMLRPGMTLPDRRIQIVSTGDPVNTADDAGADANDNLKIENLSKYFHDPDGVLVFIKVTKMETDADKPVIDLHSIDATTDAAADGDPPDGTNSDDTVIIEPLKAGTVTVMVEALDVGRKSVTATFMVEVFASGTNVAPQTNDNNTIPALTGASDATDGKRLTIGESRKHLEDVDFDDHFTDADVTRVGSDDMLTLSVKYYPAGTTFTNGQFTDGTDPDPVAELAADKVGVSAVLSDDTWSGGADEDFTLTFTGIRGTDNSSSTATENGHIVALIATDTFGLMTAKTFQVLVNNPPKAEGAQASTSPPGKALTLADASKELRFMDMGINTQTTTTPADTETIDLVEANAGYFHDPDQGDTLTCRINRTSGEGAKFMLAADTSIVTVDPDKMGPASVTLACVDSFNQHSPEATLNVNVTHRNDSLQ